MKSQHLFNEYFYQLKLFTNYLTQNTIRPNYFVNVLLFYSFQVRMRIVKLKLPQTRTFIIKMNKIP